MDLTLNHRRCDGTQGFQDVPDPGYLKGLCTPNLHLLTCRLPAQALHMGHAAQFSEMWMERGMQKGKALGSHRANDPEQVVVSRLLLAHSSLQAVVQGGDGSFPAAFLADPDTDTMLQQRRDPLTMVGTSQAFDIHHPDNRRLLSRIVRAVRLANGLIFDHPEWRDLFDRQNPAMQGVRAKRFDKATLYEGSLVYSRHCHR